MLDAVIVDESVMRRWAEIFEEAGRRRTFVFALGKMEGGAAVAGKFLAKRCWGDG